MAKPKTEAPKPTGADVRNHQKPVWVNFDQCWAVCVKNGNSILKESAKAHLKSIGKWNDQTKWIEGLQHFGIPVEK